MATERRNCLITVIKKLRHHLQLSRKLDVLDCEQVPEDVKEGHFAVVAKNEEEKPIRFVVELCVLKHPEFLRLLKKAEEEFGFHHSGAVEVPCPPDELRRILQHMIC